MGGLKNMAYEDDLKEMKKIHMRMGLIISELLELETGEKVSYAEVKTDYRWILHLLESRREKLQKQGNKQ